MSGNFNYPDKANYAAWYATKAGMAEADVVVGKHIGPASPGGVDPHGSFDGYTPIHRIDNPADGINDAADYVVYFKDENDDFFKATNADFSTLTQLTSGAEFDLCQTF